jgi:hypothetical protein
MEPTIKRAIGLIDEEIKAIDSRIKKLQLARSFLIQGFESNGSEHPVSSESTFNYESKGTRKDQLIALLKAEGALTRKEIREKTKFPIGTVSFLLNNKEAFSHTDDGKWHLKGNK